MIVWLSSYPRSGNTFFRVILNNIFNIKTYSIYDDTEDIGEDETTSNIVGHVFLPKDFDINIARSSKETYYIKTHELLYKMNWDQSDKVIYLIRDGRESTLSFAKHRKNYYGKSDELTDVIYGNTAFNSWGEHVKQWMDVENSLIIKFEDLTQDPTAQLEQISNYINIKPMNNIIPTFQDLQDINPKFFRSGKQNSWEKHFSDMEHIAFWLRNHKQMIAFGYTNNIPKEVKEPDFDKYALLFENEINALRNSTLNSNPFNNKNKILEQKLDIANSNQKKIKNAIQNFIAIKFVTSPYKKYKSYKSILTLYKDL